MNVQIQETKEVRQVVREELVNEIVSLWVKGTKDLNKIAKEMVLLASDMNGDERNSVIRKLVKIGCSYDRIERMMACASRGIVDAEHLYGDTRKVTANMIRIAKPDALREIADKNFEFVIVDAKGKSVLMQTKKLNANDICKVWHWKTGAISDKTQRKERQELLNGRKATAGALRAKVVSAIPLGNGELEIRYHTEDSDDIDAIIFPTKMLRKFLA